MRGCLLHTDSKPKMMMPKTKQIFISSAFLLLAKTSVQAEPCSSYSDAIVLQGFLKRLTFPEQPNYESIAKGDAKASYFFISLHEPFCVAKGNDVTEDAEQGIQEVQLVFSEPAMSYRQLRPYLGKEVKCRGTFFHAISGHHHSPVLLDEAECQPLENQNSFHK